MNAGDMQFKERIFDPVLQRFRDDTVERRKRSTEDKDRTAHLNRAMDIQVIREQPFNIVSHESKLESIAPGMDPLRTGDRHCPLRTTQGRGGFPTTTLDFNLVSNLPLDEHHWAPPEERPRCMERQARGRKVPAYLIKDYNIVSNRYLEGHDAKIARDKRANLLEGTAKYVAINRLNPITQQCIDPRHEARMQQCDDARVVEVNLRHEAVQPPSYTGRPAALHNMITNEAIDPDTLRMVDLAEKERKERYRNRHVKEHNQHVQDLKGDHIREVRKLNRVAHARHAIPLKRGHDIVTNLAFGQGPKYQERHEPYTKPPSTMWETVELTRARSMPSLHAPGGPGREGPSIENRSTRSRASGASVTASAGALAAPPGRTAPLQQGPPPPSVPGSPGGSVYSRAKSGSAKGGF
eukprot:CAMPEP_0178446670 /NCGR_PEP_ID=MMETSP0689_2-20121128/40945_1 /TAXON_ID=160604 /ORGANISM="Amphidinium massartii, Strain CS-259" /LENGTH=408 /DNA_ID=CAMNT_0020071545 /DNA_START=258 /DNA_END=1484 /DNA_ORIENTATION=-